MRRRFRRVYRPLVAVPRRPGGDHRRIEPGGLVRRLSQGPHVGRVAAQFVGHAVRLVAGSPATDGDARDGGGVRRVAAQIPQLPFHGADPAVDDLVVRALRTACGSGWAWTILTGRARPVRTDADSVSSGPSPEDGQRVGHPLMSRQPGWGRPHGRGRGPRCSGAAAISASMSDETRLCGSARARTITWEPTSPSPPVPAGPSSAPRRRRRVGRPPPVRARGVRRAVRRSGRPGRRRPRCRPPRSPATAR